GRYRREGQAYCKNVFHRFSSCTEQSNWKKRKGQECPFFDAKNQAAVFGAVDPSRVPRSDVRPGFQVESSRLRSERRYLRGPSTAWQRPRGSERPGDFAGTLS